MRRRQATGVMTDRAPQDGHLVWVVCVKGRCGTKAKERPTSEGAGFPAAVHRRAQRVGGGLPAWSGMRAQNRATLFSFLCLSQNPPGQVPWTGKTPPRGKALLPFGPNIFLSMSDHRPRRRHLLRWAVTAGLDGYGIAPPASSQRTGFFRSRLAAGCQGDLVHDLRILALHQHVRIVGDRFEQR